MTKIAIVIPARFASTRYPGKPLVALKGAGGTPRMLVERSWAAAQAVPGISQVIVATDDERIAEAVRGFGGEVAMTPASCRNGTERCAAALPMLSGEVDVVVNLQGDAPLTPPHFVSALIERMVADPSIAVATPVVRAAPDTRRRLLADQAAGRVGGTTAVADNRGDALYFSKAVIPHVPMSRLDDPDLPLFLHIGVYAYRPAALESYLAADLSPLEELEGLEQLRFLHAGVPVRIVDVDGAGYDIWELNNPEDVPVIEAALTRRGIN